MPFALLIVTVLTVPAEPIAYSPDDDGWEGPFSALGYGCCGGCPPGFRTEWEVRREADGWATLATSGDAGVTFVDRLFGSLTHLERYCFRQRIIDGAMVGLWGPSLRTCGSPQEICFAFDRLAPASTRIVDAGVVDNQLWLELGPASDDGGGVLGHMVVLNGEVSVEIDVLAGQRLQHPLGPEASYSVQVIARDRADNQSSRSNALLVPGATPTGLPMPPAPVWAPPFTNQRYATARWPRDAGLPTDRWAAQIRYDGGLWRTASRPILTTPAAFVDVIGTGCVTAELRISRLSGSLVSDWSPPSNTLQVDTIAPIPTTPFVAVSDGGVTVAWPPAVDACPSGPVRYQVVRTSETGVEVVLGETNALGWSDVPPPGWFRYRFVATDGAGNAATSPPSLLVALQPIDGGVDGGGLAPLDGGSEVDAGTTDAGLVEADAGSASDGGDPVAEPRLPDVDGGVYRVGCACDGAPAGVLIAALALVFTRRRARRG